MDNSNDNNDLKLVIQQQAATIQQQAAIIDLMLQQITDISKQVNDMHNCLFKQPIKQKQGEKYKSGQDINSYQARQLKKQMQKNSLKRV